MKVNPTRELHKTLVGATALELLSNSNLWMFAMVKVALKVSKVWFPGKNSSVRFESLKYWLGSCSYSKRYGRGVGSRMC